MSANHRSSILFLCTGNSCRSQMAEGWARHFLGHSYDIYSAGIQKHGLNPNAVAVMKEANIDISTHTSKLLSELEGKHFDFVVTVCDHACQHCPELPKQTKIISITFEDPPKMAAKKDDPQQKLDCYRKVRDQIKQYIQKQLPSIIQNCSK